MKMLDIDFYLDLHQIAPTHKYQPTNYARFISQLDP